MPEKIYLFGFIGVIFALCIYRCTIYRNNGIPCSAGLEEETANALKKILENKKTNYRRIAVGTNANVDLIVSGVALMEKLGVVASKSGQECSQVTSLNVLGECFSYFMGKGAAAERPIATQELNSKIVSEASKLPNIQRFVGGNAALVGLKFSKIVENSQVMLCGPVGPYLKSLLPDSIFVPKSCETKDDENHLILEYQRQETWGNIVAPVANRFIMSHDIANSEMTKLEHFIEETLKFNPDLIVVSGFHLLDNQAETFWEKRINSAAVAFSRLPERVPLHLELASMTQCPVIKAIVNKLFPVVNSIGLNEQELAFITRCLRGVHADTTDLAKKDEIGFFSDIISWILKKYGKNGALSSNLTRVHFHCLYAHILAVIPSHWSLNEASVIRGSWTAYSQACDTDHVSGDVAELRMPHEFKTSLQSGETVTFKVDAPLTTVSSGNITGYITPVLVCKRPLKTVGLGDAISASGLLYNVFHL